MLKHNKRINTTGAPNTITYMSGAIEVGSNPAEGRTGLHFHFLVVTKKRCTLSAIRKKFPSCDVQPLRGKISETENYLNGNKKTGFKEPLRREILGDPPADKQQGNNSHKTEEILTAIDNGASIMELERTFFKQFLRYGNSIRELYTSLTQQRIQKEMLLTYSNVVWRDWQQACLNLICNELQNANNRAVHWWYEEEGASGKSHLAGYLQLQYNALYLEAGRKADLAYTFQNAISLRDVPIVVCDFVRTTQPSEDGHLTGNATSNNFLHNVFAFLEAIKNGRLLVTKYQSRSIVFKPPVVICFANWQPPKETMSKDRWHIVKIVKPLTGF